MIKPRLESLQAAATLQYKESYDRLQAIIVSSPYKDSCGVPPLPSRVVGGNSTIDRVCDPRGDGDGVGFILRTVVNPDYADLNQKLKNAWMECCERQKGVEDIVLLKEQTSSRMQALFLAADALNLVLANATVRVWMCRDA